MNLGSLKNPYENDFKERSWYYNRAAVQEVIQIIALRRGFPLSLISSAFCIMNIILDVLIGNTALYVL